ncbi:hypothetical protein Tco_0448180 [Tanacetum coccineum]
MDAELKRKETADSREERREKKERQIQNQKEKKEKETMAAFCYKRKKNTVCKEHAKTEDPHEDVGKLEKDGNKAIVMIKPLQQTNKIHEDSSGDCGTNPAGIWHDGSDSTCSCDMSWKEIEGNTKIRSLNEERTQVKDLLTHVILLRLADKKSTEDKYLEFGHLVGLVLEVDSLITIYSKQLRSSKESSSIGSSSSVTCVRWSVLELCWLSLSPDYRMSKPSLDEGLV